MTDTKTTIEYTITPPRGLVRVNWAELWRYRELFYIFVWRDVKIRYKQTILGFAWAVFQPFVTMVVFTVFFGGLAKVPSDGIPYPIFVYTGLVFWTYYLTALTNATNSMVENEMIIKKVYFPRIILPVSGAITPIVDVVASSIILFGMMIYYHYTPHILGILAIPLLLLVALFTAAGLGLFLASVNVKYRDVRYILPFFLNLLLYVTPVIYPTSVIPEKWQWLLYINPMTGVISAARSWLIGQGSVEWPMLAISIVSCISFVILGIIYFRKTERFFADMI